MLPLTSSAVRRRDGNPYMSHRICKTAKELSEAIKEETDVIEVEGDLSNKIVRIKVTGKVAWAVCAVSLAAAISFAIAAGATAAVPPVGGAHLVGFTAAMGTSASILGSAAVPALTIGICAGGIPYTKAGILSLVNQELCCDFTHILVTEGIDLDSNITPLCGAI